MSDSSPGGPAPPALPPPTEPDWRERLAGLAADFDLTPRRAAVALGVVLALGALAWWLLRPPPQPPPELTLPVATTGAAAAAPTTAGNLVVHAAGAVATPGVYTLPTGSRIGDLVEAAGGLAQDADADRLNLAGPLSDGARVYVPRIGQADVPVAVGETPAVPGEAGEGTAPGGQLVDVNTADATQLETLPGIGPAIAEAIIEHRQQHGPFATVEDLLDVSGIGDARLADIRDLVTV